MVVSLLGLTGVSSGIPTNRVPWRFYSMRRTRAGKACQETGRSQGGRIGRAAIAAFVGVCALASAARADLSTAETKRVREAAQVLKEIHAVPDKDIPQDLWDKASCVIVVPSLKKAAFVFGG